MAITYRVYGNGGTGGALNLATPLATVSGLAYATAALAHPGDWTFLVRAYDAGTGFEDLNSDARVRIVLDASGADVTGRPAPPTRLSASPIAGGGIRVEWAYLPVPNAKPPTSFRVWAQVGAINYALAPSGTAVYSADRTAYALDVAGLADGVTYTVAARAVNASGDDANTATVTCTADAAGPLPVDNLTGSPTY